ncbi:MAG: YicC family protein [Deltaproteobacteria bacterium]|nr:YicC family protein [Deltaproteobacteria bacterium]MBT4269620.1 YicC family protein [Deltaproteobacteria bacterium]MBT6613128.1 YicC family protein [Deltaproteobacteria bacterium]MBT7715573.1 YicC family protein [Deltaproteobacteria bacterium]MBT7888630.1 YicC family protein [Deltaproteobacteria bacterium]
MTGFCKAEVQYNNLSCSIEIKSVNHRFLDARIHFPKQFQHFEEVLKKQLKGPIQRGKVDVYIQMGTLSAEKERLKLDEKVWENVKGIVTDIEKDLGKTVQINLSDLLSIKNLLSYEQNETEDLEAYQALFETAIQKGVAELTQMRQREGELLLKELNQHMSKLAELIEAISGYKAEALMNQRLKLQKNLEALGAKYEESDPRIMQEIGIFMDRSDITEEIERFNSHLVQMNELFSSQEAVGRKLDFILQELNREANTLCSKSNHISITQIGVSLKSEIEKIREQVQNIE